MLEQDDQIIINRLNKFEMQMLDGLKLPSHTLDTSLPFIRIHLCLAFVLNDQKLGFSLKDIFNEWIKVKDASLGPRSDELNKIQIIFDDLGISKIYNQILKYELGDFIDELTRLELEFFKNHKANMKQQLCLLEYFTTVPDGRRSDTLSTPGLDNFIDDLVLKNCPDGSILFPYLQNAFLPIKHALLNPMAKITAYEINRSKYAFGKLLRLFYQIQSLNLVNESWLHSNLGEENEALFDVIINIAPMGQRMHEAVPDQENYPVEFNRSTKIAEVYEQHKILRHLKKNGDGYLLTGRSFAFSARNILKFVRNKLLQDQNIQTIIKFPGGLLSATGIESLLIHLSNRVNSEIKFVDTNECFSKKSRKDLQFSQGGAKEIFAAILGGEPLEHRVKNINTDHLLSNGYDIDPNRFVDNSEAAQRRRRLLANYSDYEEVFLGSEDVCKSIKRYSTVDDFQPEISVILPKIPTKNLQPTSQITELRPDHYVIELDTTKLLPGYLLHFLKSELGQLTLDLAARSAYIPTLSMKDVMELKIPLPNLKVQKNIENAFNKLEAVNTGLSNITNDLSSSPSNVETFILKLNDILGALTELSEPEKAYNKILQGEGELVEFKETFSLDVQRFKNDENYKIVKEEKIEHSCLKTIAAFLNAKGGDLFIGVNDDAVILGVDEEINQFHKGSLDKYLLHFNNRVQDRFESPIMHMVSVKPLKYSEKTVISVKVLPSENDPIFLKPNSDFYVRSTPATEKLSGNGMYTYIKQRFS